MKGPEDLALCEPALRWAQASAAEELRDLSWVDARVDAQGGYGMGELYEALPAPLRAAVAHAQRRGEVPAAEGIALLLAPVAWAMRALPWMWTPLSPWPRLLARLAEADGIDADVHGGDLERLVRLMAWLPIWRLRRGDLDAAARIWEVVRETPVEITGYQREQAHPEALRAEVLTCRSLSWWGERSARGSSEAPRIAQGFVSFQGDGEPWVALAVGDVVLSLGAGWPQGFVRLLPAWTSVRLVAAGASA